MMIRRLIVLTAIAGIILMLDINCHHATSPEENAPLTMTLDDANCTEVWLTVHSTAPGTVEIARDTTIALTLVMAEPDTEVVDYGLLPSHAYTYVARLLSGSTVSHSTTPLHVQTMDTTGNNFTWQTFTLGGASSSTLYDVAIINDTLAYAVGEMFLNDSSGQVDQQPYNIAIWDGKAWKLQKVPYYYQGQAFYGPIYSLGAFNANDIWFGIGNMIHWDGNTFNAVELPSSVWGPYRIEKIWGTSSTNFYIVGDGGSIAHYNGSSWTKIESGTTLDIRDIWGAQNAKTGNLEIYTTAGNPLISNNTAVLQINGTTAQAISDNGIYSALNGIWFSPEQYYWLVGDGVWEKHPTLSASSWSSQTLTSYLTESVRGNNINDVFICGDFGEMLHFNGVSWKSYFSQTKIDGAYLGLAVHGNTVIAVGRESPQAVILMGKR